MKKNGDKLRIEDLTAADFKVARDIVHGIVAMQDTKADTIGIVAVAMILQQRRGGLASLHNSLHNSLGVSLDDSLRDSLDASLDDSLGDSLRVSLGDSLGASLDDSLRDSLLASLGESLHESLKASLRDSLHASLHESLEASLRDSLRASMRASLHASLHRSLNASLNDSLRASLDASLHDSLHRSLDDSLHDSLSASLRNSLHDSLRDSVRASLDDSLLASLLASLSDSLHRSLNASLNASLDASLHDSLHRSLDDSLELAYCGVFWSWWLARYLIAMQWGCPLDRQKLWLLLAFCALCPIVAEQGGLPVVMPKPKRVRFQQVGITSLPFELPIYELHANGQPSVEYWGLFDLYHWHNVKIPERMGKVHCEKWEPKWLLDEKNSEVRRILLQEIGYERAIATLGANVRDKWREYELLELTVPDMPVRYQLIKMTCPSTGDVHILRAPPECDTAEQAITWCNHGNHPDSFVTEA